jgi:BirA family biotin operon repressor/biotin-[acetyl-CoA-carboxylase] ligase
VAEQNALSAEALFPLVRNTIFADNIHHWPEVESTNSLALEAASGDGAETAAQGAVFLADAQTAGRGRSNHSWYSEHDAGVYASFLLRPKISPADVLWLSLIAALAVQDAVEETTGLRADIRWPNDLLMNDKKFCGILTEASSDSMRVQYAVVGIGINVNHTQFPPDLGPIATSLRLETGARVSRVELAAALIRSLDRHYRALLKAARGPAGDSALQFGPILKKIAARSSYIYGKAVQVDMDEAGGYSGITDGLDSRGFLRVRTVQDVRTVISGSVRPLARRPDASGS